MQLPDNSTFLPSIAVDTRTADALAEIAWLEGRTVAWVVRRALEGYTTGYLEHLRSLEAGE
jgi:hypothetical protein